MRVLKRFPVWSSFLFLFLCYFVAVGVIRSQPTPPTPPSGPTGNVGGIDVSGTYPSGLVVNGLGSGDATYANHILTIPTSTGVYRIGPSAGISASGSTFLFGTGAAGNAQAILEAGALYNGNGAANIAFSVLVGNDTCIFALSVYRGCFDGSGERIGSTLVYGFSSGVASAAVNDTGISRDSAGVIDVGNGTTGNISGTVKASTAVFGATSITLGGHVCTAATGSFTCS